MDSAMRAEPQRSLPIAGAVDRRIRPLPPATRYSLRLRDADVAPAGAALGLDLSMPINRAAVGERCTAIRLGPDEWLLLGGDGAIAAALDAGLPDRVFALVDISHRQAAISLESVNADAMLNALCPLDLSLAAFPVGMATRTVFAKADIVLWRTGADAFHVEIWRSFAPYVVALLGEIGREYPDRG
jgi:sarcosine oxidase subunit gamma